MDTAHNCMSLLVIWMLSDTAMRYFARSSCLSFARTTPFSSTTISDLTSPACRAFLDDENDRVLDKVCYKRSTVVKAMGMYIVNRNPPKHVNRYQTRHLLATCCCLDNVVSPVVFYRNDKSSPGRVNHIMGLMYKVLGLWWYNEGLKWS